jgi:hypothetical protein
VQSILSLHSINRPINRGALNQVTMRFSLALNLTLVALASACYFPFNDARFINTTYAAEVIANMNSQPDMGWNTIVVGDSLIKPWAPTPAPPTDLPGEQGLVTIPYCYRTPEDRAALHETIERGIEIWRQKLPQASQGNALRFSGFREYGKKGVFPPCWDPKTDFWNPAVRHGTLMIQESKDAGHGSWSTVGYIPYDPANGSKDYEPRHQLHLSHNSGSDGSLRTTEAAHELGHVMGFVHEQQRHDRDDYVSFNCENLDGYWHVKEIVDSHPEWGVDMGDVCSSNYYGGTPELQWWSVLDYSKDMGTTAGKPRLQMYGKDYDVVSIMQYASDAGAFWDVRNLDECPLIKWKMTGDEAPPAGTRPTKDNAEYIFQPIAPSDGDVDGVKAMYPW